MDRYAGLEQESLPDDAMVRHFVVEPVHLGGVVRPERIAEILTPVQLTCRIDSTSCTLNRENIITRTSLETLWSQVRRDPLALSLCGRPSTSKVQVRR